MLFSSRLPLTTLLAWCRALKHGLDAGLSPVRVFRQQAKSGPPAARSLAADLADRLEKGESLADAIRPDRGRFPTLFAELIAVGEHAGRLSETFTVLEEYFETVQTARKDLMRALMWPGFMFFSAIGIVTLLILIMGLIPGGFDPLGFGLTGVSGAIFFLFVAGSVTAITAFLIVQLNHDERARGRIEAAVLPFPGLGTCVRAFALQRFSVAFHMTSEAGIRADQALRLSLRATTNEAYSRQAERAAKRARAGAEVAEILEECGPTLFPGDYVDTVEVGETSGQLAEVMAKLAKQYQDESSRKLKWLASVVGGVVYAGVAIMVIVLIFRIFSSYIATINQFTSSLTVQWICY